MNKPNILHLFTDQQRFDTIRALGNPVIRTPSLDALARSGMAFTSAYTPSPVCVAARCSMLHGQYPMRTGCYNNGPMPDDERETFLDALARAGYRTHGIGKCHFTPDPLAMKGFQSRVILEELGCGKGSPYLPALAREGFGHVTEPHGIRNELYYTPQVSQLPQRLHPTQYVADRAIDFLREDHGRPWYLYAGFIAPHPPFAPPVPWNRLYRSPLMPMPHLPPGYEGLRTFVNLGQNRYKYKDAGRDANAMRTLKAYYYACVSFVDYQVGRIVQALKDSGQYDNTLIVFTSDHGELLGDYGCYGKRSMHDSCCRVPMLLSLPGVFEGGRTVDTPVSLVDVAPTLLSLAGAEFQTHQPDGVSLLDLPAERSVYSAFCFDQEAWGMRLADNPYPENLDLFSASLTTYMIADERWKYFYSMPDQKHFLFDRVNDPKESANMAYVPCCRAARNEMQARLTAYLGACGDTRALDGGDWRVTRRYELPPEGAALFTHDAGGLLPEEYLP